MAKKKTPEIVNAIVEYIKAYDNPDNEQGEYKSIKVYQLNCFDVSYNFRFKWVVKQSEIDEIAAWNKELKPINEGKTLLMVLREYRIELEAAKDTSDTEFGCEFK